MSTIKVDTIQKAGGASEISIDKLGGVTAAATVNVIAEGGTNTTNLSQGLCKAHVSLNGAATPAILGSFNISGITDNGVGDTQFDFSSAMNDAVYSMAGVTNDSGASTYHQSTSTTQFRTVQRLDADGSTASDTDNSTAVFGDLA